jgi:hypothetical protein
MRYCLAVAGLIFPLIAHIPHVTAQPANPPVAQPAVPPIDCTHLADCAQALVNLANRLIGENRQLAARVSALEAIKAGVVAFELEKCPEGWAPYPAAFGRFVRGLDPGNPARTKGSLEDDAFQGHTFGDGNGRYLRYSTTHTTNDPPNGYSDMYSTGIFGMNPVFGPTNPAKVVTDAVNGVPRTANETRPKNVALLYCIKK